MKALTADGGAEVAGARYAATDDDRITRVGKFLRKTRLDEVPQFINILKNEMAIIGPRPERPEFVAELAKQMPFYSLRHLIKPGLTGWAQIKQSYYATLEENLRKLEYDLYYLKNRGFWIDVAIVLRTINIVIGMRGR
jgi:lipopolysaccharide/colanic/teichoic acid biosynthesis glycosyltransferase